MMFVVAGATGNTGSMVMETLRQAGRPVRGLTRDLARANSPDGVEWVAAALDDPAALRRAFDGAEGAYLLCPPDLSAADPIAAYEQVATAGAEAARAAGLKRVVLLSSLGAHLPSGTGPVRGLHEAERILADAVPEVVFLRPASFMENWRGVFPVAREQGVLPTFYADLAGSMPTVSTRDIGTTAAALLLEHSPPRAVELSGPADYSVNDTAAAMAQVLGRPVAPVQPPRESWVEVLEGNGVGPAYAALLAEMYDGINSGRMTWEGVPNHRRGAVTIGEGVASWV